MASEDSDQVLPGCLPIHRFNDFRDFHETADITMPAVREHSHAQRELLKVALLSRSKRVGLEERNNRSHKILPAIDNELAQVLAVIVLTFIDVHTTHAEEPFELLKRRSTAHALGHNKSMRDLVPGLVAFAVRPTWLPNEPNGEAPLSVYEASNPAKPNQSFLLITCTQHIITVPPTWDGTRSVGYSGFPAYSQMHSARLPARGAAILP